jgi:integrase
MRQLPKATPRRGASYLTRRGNSLAFQIRVPRDLDPDSSLAPIRVTLGALPIREARRQAKSLAGLAEIAFGRLRTREMSETQLTEPEKIEARGPATSAFLAIGSDGYLVGDASEKLVRGLAGLRMRLNSGKPDQGDSLGGKLDRAEDELRRKSGLPPRGPPPTSPAGPDTDQATMTMLKTIAAGQAAMTAEFASLRRAEVGPLFSEASEAYRADLARANGEHDKELTYLVHRTKVFLKIIGDKPVNAYTKADLTTFANEISYLPPNISKQAGYSIDKVLSYIAEGKEGGVPLMGESTLITNYLGKIKTILKAGCATIGVPFALRDVDIRIPKGVRPPQEKLLLDYEALDKLFRAGIKSGNFVDIVLPLLGFITGRRLGLLVYLMREDILRYFDVWMIAPRSVVFEDDRWKTVPFKTDESLKAFVLHEIFHRIGLIEFWQAAGPGYIFSELHGGKIKDPADAAQKRMGRLYDRAGVDRKIFKTFHGLRHSKINEDRELAISPRTTRLQVGHELGDVHDRYGSSQLRRSELQTVASAPLPDAVDWTMFEGLDLEKISRHRVTRGRPKPPLG